MSLNKFFTTVVVSLMVTLLLAFVFGGVAITIHENVRLIWSLLIGFCGAVLILHIAAYFLQNITTTWHLRAIDYVYLSVAAIGLCAISTIDADVAEWQAKDMTHFVNATHRRANSWASSSKDYYAKWPPEFEFLGHSAKTIQQWSAETHKLLNEEYDSENWSDHIRIGREMFRENPPWEVKYVLNEMELCIDSRNELRELQLIVKNELYFYVKYFGYWAVAFALSLRLVKVTIETFGWINPEPVA